MASLHAAVEAKSAERVRALLAAGADADERDRVLMQTPLHVAARKGLVDVMRALLDGGASLSVRSKTLRTALYEACDHKHEQAALLLLERGGSANVHGERGRTEFHVAIKRGLMTVVRVMLELGLADPNVASFGGFNDTMSYVKRSSASRADREALRTLIPQFATLESAVAAQNAKAIEAVVRRAFGTNNLDVAVEVFLRARQYHTMPSAFEERLLLSSIAANRSDLFNKMVSATAGDKSLCQRVEDIRFEGDTETTALHIAAFYGHVAFVDYLLSWCAMNPEVEDALGRTALQLVSEAKDPTGQLQTKILQATYQRRFRLFTARALRHATSDVTSVSDLEDLTPVLTSSHDVRVLLRLARVSSSADTGADITLRTVLTKAFQQVIKDRLMVSDREALLFKMVLKDCHAAGILSETEVDQWEMQAVKVNMENAPWVKSLKQSVMTVAWRADDLDRQSMALRQQFRGLKRAVEEVKLTRGIAGAWLALRRALVMCSIVLSLVGVDGVSDALGEAADLTTPLSEVTTSLMAVTRPIEADESELPPVRDEVRPLLQRAGIDANELVAVLQEVIQFERTRLKREKHETPIHQPEAAEDGVGAKTDATQLNDDEREVHHRDVGDSVELMEFPLHSAVRHSGGDLAKFHDVSDYYMSAEDLNAVARSREENLSGEWESHEDTAVELAARLGYVEIAKYLLKQPEYTAEREKRFVTMQRAHTSRKARAAVVA